jgi:hypothetical protein
MKEGDYLRERELNCIQWALSDDALRQGYNPNGYLYRVECMGRNIHRDEPYYWWYWENN